MCPRVSLCSEPRPLCGGRGALLHTGLRGFRARGRRAAASWQRAREMLSRAPGTARIPQRDRALRDRSAWRGLCPAGGPRGERPPQPCPARGRRPAPGGAAGRPVARTVSPWGGHHAAHKAPLLFRVRLSSFSFHSRKLRWLILNRMTRTSNPFTGVGGDWPVTAEQHESSET